MALNATFRYFGPLEQDGQAHWFGESGAITIDPGARRPSSPSAG